jgi:hypothetical protein
VSYIVDVPCYPYSTMVDQIASATSDVQFDKIFSIFLDDLPILDHFGWYMT